MGRREYYRTIKFFCEVFSCTPSVPRKMPHFLAAHDFMQLYFMCRLERVKEKRENKVDRKIFLFLVLGHLDLNKPKRKVSHGGSNFLG